MQRQITISVDAMGGDNAPKAVVGGLRRALPFQHNVRYLLHGRRSVLEPLLKRRSELRDRCEIVDCPDVVAMDEKPAQALRRGRNSSMWSAIDAVGQGKADVAISAGNTGALMTMSVVRLRPAGVIDRPAIAALWPSLAPKGFAVVLDMGADVRADVRNLVQYALMGAEYARISLGIDRPRVAILNVGHEETKGRDDLRQAAEALRQVASDSQAAIEFVGFIEGNDIPFNKADVIVTDGFAGNIALKAAEGTARLIAQFMSEAFKRNWLSRIGAIFAYPSLLQLKKRMDPRRVNGGVFLGLNGVVVKSHGSADATGFANALFLAGNLAHADLPGRIATQVKALSPAAADSI